MLYSLENDILVIEINDVGAELYSIKGKNDGFEYLWQGDPQYWSGRAYNLFPICGRITDGRYIYKGSSYDICLHGFARDAVFSCIGRGDGEICFELTANAETKKSYPFDFRLRVRYILDGGSLRTVYEVDNLGESEMIFALGGHPGFNLPLEDGRSFSYYRLEFAEPRETVHELVQSERCYVLREERTYPLSDGRVLPLSHSLFDNDAIFLYDTCGSVTLTAGGKKSVRVDYPDMKYIGFWHLPHTEAPYVCIEPWTSCPSYDGELDDLETKRDMLRLEAGGHYTTSFTVSICTGEAAQ